MRILKWILIFLPLITFGQTRLDSLILAKINYHRAGLGINLLMMAPEGLCVSQNHAKWMAISGFPSHEQVWEVPDFTNEPNFGLRNWKCGIDTLSPKTVIGELIDYQVEASSFSDVELANLIFNTWINSEENRLVLEFPDIIWCGISTERGGILNVVEEDPAIGDFHIVQYAGDYLFVSLNVYNFGR